MAEPTLLQQALLETIGPVTTVVVGGVVVAGVAKWLERRREVEAARLRLTEEMPQAAFRFYLETQRFWRATTRERLTGEQLVPVRQRFDDQYLSFREDGELIERRMRTWFRDDEPRRHWHAVVDLLTVRYFQLLEQATPALLKDNSGPDHSGLTEFELLSPTNVLDAYRNRLDEATAAVRTSPRLNGNQVGASLKRSRAAGRSDEWL